MGFAAPKFGTNENSSASGNSATIPNTPSHSQEAKTPIMPDKRVLSEAIKSAEVGVTVGNGVPADSVILQSMKIFTVDKDEKGDANISPAKLSNSGYAKGGKKSSKGHPKRLENSSSNPGNTGLISSASNQQITTTYHTTTVHHNSSHGTDLQRPKPVHPAPSTSSTHQQQQLPQQQQQQQPEASVPNPAAFAPIPTPQPVASPFIPSPSSSSASFSLKRKHSPDKPADPGPKKNKPVVPAPFGIDREREKEKETLLDNNNSRDGASPAKDRAVPIASDKKGSSSSRNTGGSSITSYFNPTPAPGFHSDSAASAVHRIREAEDTRAMTAALEKREHECSQREKKLDEREARLEKREADVEEQEQAIASGEYILKEEVLKAQSESAEMQQKSAGTICSFFFFVFFGKGQTVISSLSFSISSA